MRPPMRELREHGQCREHMLGIENSNKGFNKRKIAIRLNRGSN